MGGDEESIENWPVPPRYESQFNSLKDTHVMLPLAAYDENDALISPENMEAKLSGALVQLTFGLRHYHIHTREDNRDSYPAGILQIIILDPPPPKAPKERSPYRQNMRRGPHRPTTFTPRGEHMIDLDTLISFGESTPSTPAPSTLTSTPTPSTPVPSTPTPSTPTPSTRKRASTETLDSPLFDSPSSSHGSRLIAFHTRQFVSLRLPITGGSETSQTSTLHQTPIDDGTDNGTLEYIDAPARRVNNDDKDTLYRGTQAFRLSPNNPLIRLDHPDDEKTKVAKLEDFEIVNSAPWPPKRRKIKHGT